MKETNDRKKHMITLNRQKSNAKTLTNTCCNVYSTSMLCILQMQYYNTRRRNSVNRV